MVIHVHVLQTVWTVDIVCAASQACYHPFGTLLESDSVARIAMSFAAGRQVH